MNTIDRLFAKVQKTDGCWNWVARKSPQGYGRISVGNVNKLAHRVAYELMVGHIGEMHVLHSCDNPSCVNPSHLWLGTNADNIADKVRKNRTPDFSGEKNPKNKLSAKDVLDIRRMTAEGMKQRVVAEKYGITPVHVANIATKKAWGHL